MILSLRPLWTFAVFVTFIGLLLPNSKTQAQEFLSDLTQNTPPVTYLRFSGTDEARIEGDRNESPVQQQKFLISTPVNRVLSDPANMQWRWSQLQIQTDKKLNTGAAVPSYLLESEFGANYKRVESSQKFWGLNLSYGSASDQLFRSYRTSTLGGTFFWSESDDPQARWIWLINYSNNRTFANNIPLPGVAYVYTPSREFTGIFGFPFIFIRKKWSDPWSSVLFLGPYLYKIELARSLGGPLITYSVLENSNMGYFRENRTDEDARLFYSESRWLLGLRSPVSKEISLDGYGGLAFARSLYEGKDFKLLSEDKVLLENRWILGAQVSGRF